MLYPDSVYYGNNTVTANILPLAIGIVPDDCKDDVIKNVVENICVKNKNHATNNYSDVTATSRTEGGSLFLHHYVSLTFNYKLDAKKK